MSHDAQSHHLQQIEHLMTAVVACRSVVKYNLPLSDEQRHELLNDLDAALEYLRVSLIPSAPTPPVALPGAALSDPSSSHQSELVPVITFPDNSSQQKNEYQDQATLTALYRMYHSFLSVNHQVNINTFIVRFNDVMSTLQTIQNAIHDDYRDYDEDAIHDSLHHVRTFIADLYYIFMEFMRALSDTLQKNNVQLDTEKLNSFSASRAPGEQHSSVASSSCDLAALLGVYEAHQRLNEKRGLLTGRLTEATAFLEFLKESVWAETQRNKRDEIVVQLNNASRLLLEVSRLLADYEQATATLFVR